MSATLDICANSPINTMTEPQFIPSGLPHAVEMPDGSSLAKSKSRKLENDVRRTEDAASEADQILADQVILRASRVSGAQTPRADRFERASDAAERSAGRNVAVGGQSLSARPSSKAIYDTAMADMDFPARFIQLKIDNDKVRTQLQVLESELRHND